VDGYANSPLRLLPGPIPSALTSFFLLAPVSVPVTVLPGFFLLPLMLLCYFGFGSLMPFIASQPVPPRDLSKSKCLRIRFVLFVSSLMIRL